MWFVNLFTTNTAVYTWILLRRTVCSVAFSCLPILKTHTYMHTHVHMHAHTCTQNACTQFQQEILLDTSCTPLYTIIFKFNLCMTKANAPNLLLSDTCPTNDLGSEVSLYPGQTATPPYILSLELCSLELRTLKEPGPRRNSEPGQWGHEDECVLGGHLLPPAFCYFSFLKSMPALSTSFY